MSASGRARTLGKRLLSSWASGICSAWGQVRWASWTRCRYSWTLPTEMPRLAAIWRWLSFCWYLRRSRSLILRMDNRSLGTVPSLAWLLSRRLYPIGGYPVSPVPRGPRLVFGVIILDANRCSFSTRITVHFRRESVIILNADTQPREKFNFAADMTTIHLAVGEPLRERI